MIKKYKKHTAWFGLIFTIASALAAVVLTWIIFSNAEFYAGMRDSLYDCGMDAMGALVCVALYYGCMRQNADGTREFRFLAILVSAAFLVNYCMYCTIGVPGQDGFTFLFIMLSKLIDLVMIFFFYRYVRITLNFKDKLAGWADRGIPILMVLEALVILSNIIYPTTFMVGGKEVYQTTGASAAEDIYLVVASLITTILIIRSKNPRSQKIAALTFIFLPVINYLSVSGQFGNASQYGMVLMSLIIIFCIIFNDKSSKLASTQTELDMATQIQVSMLPSIFPAFPQREEFDLYASMDTAKEVGGDFYDFFPLDENRICFLIADVSGKGVPAALFMMITKTMIKDYALIKDSTSEIFTTVNARLCENNDQGMFATAWIGIVDTRTMTLQYTNAGHNPPFFQRRGESCREIKDLHGLFLAGMDFTQYKQGELQLQPGDRLLLYTDGVTEAHDRENNLYGEERLQKVLERTRDCRGEEVLAQIRDDVNDYEQGVPQFDDITMVILTIKG